MARDNTYDNFKKNKSPKLKKIRHLTEYIIVLSLMKFTGLWSIKVNQKFGLWIGKLAYLTAKKDRGIARYQLDFCYPQLSGEQKDQIIADMFKNLGQTLFETIIINKIRKNRDKWIKLDNPEVVKEATQLGNGAIMIFGHIANWELIGIVCEMLDVSGIILGAPIDDKRLDKVLLKNRRSKNIEVVQHGSKMAGILIAKSLKKNDILLMSFDQDIRVNSVFVDFFGRKASTTRNISTFSQKYNAPVISVFSKRLEDGTHQFSFENLSSSSNPNEEDGILNLTQLYSSKLEEHIRKTPSQWVWNHRRWKTQPDN